MLPVVVHPVCRTPAMNTAPDTHSKLIGYLLWLFGFTGSHRFYYGKPLSDRTTAGKWRETTCKSRTCFEVREIQQKEDAEANLKKQAIAPN